MYDQEKKKARGFGFLSFENDAAVDGAVAEHYVNIQNKQVEIKRAELLLSTFYFLLYRWRSRGPSRGTILT